MKKLLFLLLFFIGAFLFGLYQTDGLYLLKAAQIIWLRGQTDACIYDFTAHDTRAIKAGQHQPWELDPQYNKVAISDTVQAILDELETTAFLVIKDGKILTEKYFLEGSQTEQSALWSITKTYTSFAILKAIDDGLIDSVDDPVVKYLPEWPDKQKPQLTLRHLASMSAGLYWDEMDHSPFALIAKFNFYDDLNSITIKDMYPLEKPGTLQHYNSGGTQLLGMVLQRVLGDKNISTYIAEKFWQPLGCQQDALYVLDSEAKGMEKAFGGMVSSARDAARLGQVLLDNGQWKGQTFFRQEHMNLIKAVPYNNKTYGYGLWTGLYEGERFYLQAGFRGQFCITVPSHQLVIARLGHKAYKKQELEDLPKEVFSYIGEAIRIAE